MDTSNNNTNTKATIPGYVITQNPFAKNVFNLSIDVNKFLEHTNDVRTIVVWFNSLSSDDTVYLNLVQMSDGRTYPMGAYITILNAITTCKANIIGCVDHLISGIDAYFLLVCKTLKVSPFGQVLIKGKIAGDSTANVTLTKALNSFANKLLYNAKEIGLLADEEYQSVIGGATVILSPSVLKERTE